MRLEVGGEERKARPGFSPAQGLAQPAQMERPCLQPVARSPITPMKLPRQWHSFAPLGFGHQKPFHYVEMLRTAWTNRDQWPFAWRILRDGVCDGCALGTSGLRDWTIPGVHLCMVRLELLRLNTAPALDVHQLADVGALAGRSSADLRSSAGFRSR